MRILIVTQHFWPEDFRINELAIGFKDNGHDVSVLTGYPNYPEGKIYSEFKKDKDGFKEFNSIKITRIPILPRGSSKFTLALNYLSFVLSGILLGPLLLRKKKFDMIFVFEPSPITVCLPAILLKYLKSSKLSLWVLDLWPQSLYAVGYLRKDSVLVKLTGRLVRYVYSKCDLILGTSKSFVKEIKKDCVNFDRIKYFPNWFESIYDNSSILPAEEININNNEFKLIFAGNLGDAQDLPTILNGMLILKNCKNIKLYILGDGKRFKWIKDFIDKNEMHNVVLLGRYPNKRMPEFFYHADALIVSLKPHNIYDMTIPGKLQSYLISNRPVLGVIGGESANIINSCRCGLVSEPGNYKDFANNVKKLYAMESNDREKIARNGYDYASQNFNKINLFKQLECWMKES
tara:strand:+ start:15141 stop:16352 length:1212 start_codon:yes stop_codon:yes gene_type:complete